MSFDLQIFEVLEAQRIRVGALDDGKPQPRSEYIQKTLLARWRAEGVWPPATKAKPKKG